MCNLYLKADVFSLPVTVQPQHQVVDTLALLLEVTAHVGLTRGGGGGARHGTARHAPHTEGKGDGCQVVRRKIAAAA